MKIVLCNKYYFLNGGTERYLFEVSGGLSSAGHTAIPFSVAYAGNRPSPHSDYFLPPPGAADQSHFRNIRWTPASLLRHFDRVVYSFEARRRLSVLLDHAGGADIGYILNVYNYMSHSIIHTFHKRGIPVVMRLGDYHLLCPSYLLLRDGRPCTRCVSGNYLHGLRHRCVKGNVAASAARVLSMYLQRGLGLFRLVDAFVTPCRFMHSMLVRGGFPESRIHVIPTPAVKHKTTGPPVSSKNPYILFFGRISVEKGLDNLIEAYQRLNEPEADLVLIGRGYDGEKERLEERVRPDFRDRIHFIDFLEGSELARWIAGALFSVVPSRCYDNAPAGINESLAQGIPVVAANIGGIPEQLEDGVTGKLFAPESVDALRDALKWMLSHRVILPLMGNAGRERVERRCSMSAHVQELTALFASLVK